MATQQNYSLGRGRVYFDEFVAGTFNPTGEQYIGNTPDFNMNVTSQTLDHYTSDDAVKILDDQALIQIDRKGTFHTDNIGVSNLARFFLGTTGIVTSTAGNITGEQINSVTTDRYYQLGVSTSTPSGVRNVNTVVVKNDAATPVTYVEGTDYTVDLVRARIYVIAGGAIADLTNLRVDYATTVASRDQVITSSNKQIIGALRFVSSNATGVDRDYFAPYVKITPNGDFALKGDQWQSLSFNVQMVKKDSLTEVLYIDGQAA